MLEPNYKSLIFCIINLSLSHFIFIAPNVDHRFCQHHQPSTVPSTTAHLIEQDNKEISLDKQALIEYIDKDGRYDDTLCNVFRSGINSKLKISSYGFLATFFNCSVIVGFTEQPCSEGSKYKKFILLVTMYNA